jgi:Flp pilus assembly protein TadG
MRLAWWLLSVAESGPKVGPIRLGEKRQGGRQLKIALRGLVQRVHVSVSADRRWPGQAQPKRTTGEPARPLPPIDSLPLGLVRRLAREEAGVAAIEFAVFATVFLMIVAATVDIGLLLFTQSELDAAVSAGAEYAANSAALVASNPSGLAANIADIVNNANGTNWASSTVNVNNSDDSTGCYCPTGAPGNWSWGNTVTCGSACSGGGVAGQFVTITATTSISPLFPAFGFVRGTTISRSALVETQ